MASGEPTCSDFLQHFKASYHDPITAPCLRLAEMGTGMGQEGLPPTPPTPSAPGQASPGLCQRRSGPQLAGPGFGKRLFLLLARPAALPLTPRWPLDLPGLTVSSSEEVPQTGGRWGEPWGWTLVPATAEREGCGHKACPGSEPTLGLNPERV